MCSAAWEEVVANHYLPIAAVGCCDVLDGVRKAARATRGLLNTHRVVGYVLVVVLCALCVACCM
jgi:hypothetical protein